MEETWGLTPQLPKTVGAQCVVICRPYCIVCLCYSGLFVCNPDCTTVQYFASYFPPCVKVKRWWLRGYRCLWGRWEFSTLYITSIWAYWAKNSPFISQCYLWLTCFYVSSVMSSNVKTTGADCLLIWFVAFISYWVSGLSYSFQLSTSC